MVHKWAAVLLVSGGALFFMACEPEVGSPCSVDQDAVDKVPRDPDQVTIRQDVAYENCSKAYCMSSYGSRPYCTRRCEGALDCPAGFECQASIRFGALGCKDWDQSTDCTDTPDELYHKYCTAPDAAVIEERDDQYGRSSSGT